MARSDELPPARGDRRKALGYDTGPAAHNPDWQPYKDYAPIFDMMDNNPPQGLNPAGTDRIQYQLDRDSLGSVDDPEELHDMHDDMLDPDDESLFAGRELAMNHNGMPNISGVADTLYRNRSDQSPDHETMLDLQMADAVTQDAGRRIIPENWDKFMNEQQPSDNFDDRRDDLPMSDEEVQQLMEDYDLDSEAGILHDPRPNTGPNDPMSKALGSDDLDKMLMMLMSPGSKSRIRT